MTTNNHYLTTPESPEVAQFAISVVDLAAETMSADEFDLFALEITANDWGRTTYENTISNAQ